MKRKVLGVALVLVLVLPCAVTAFAYTVPSSTVVYVTPTGSKYHREDCTHIKNSYRTMSIAAAEAQGYSACFRCNPDVLTGEYESNWDGSGGSGGGGETGNPSSTQKHTPIWKELLEILWGIVCAIFSIFISAAAFSAIIYPIMWVLEFFARLRKK